MGAGSELKRIYEAKQAIRDTLVELGVEVPETEGLGEYAKYISQLKSDVAGKD